MRIRPLERNRSEFFGTAAVRRGQAAGRQSADSVKGAGASTGNHVGIRSGGNGGGIFQGRRQNRQAAGDDTHRPNRRLPFSESISTLPWAERTESVSKKSPSWRVLPPARCSATPRKAALRMAEAMCERSVTVSDEIFAEVRRHFEEKAIVEIAATIALENMRARFNRALEIPSDGFCELPLNHPALSAVADLPPNPFPLEKGE